MIIGIDVDEVVANLHAPWLKWVKETLGVENPNFDTWRLQDRYGDEVLDFLAPWIYDEDVVMPFPRTHPALAEIRKNHFITFVTACAGGTEDAKKNWLLRHDILRPGFGDLFVSIHDKSNAEVDMLVDDNINNVRGFNGLGVLVTSAHNVNDSYPFRVASLWEFASLL